MASAGNPATKEFFVLDAETAQVADMGGAAILRGHDVVDTRSPPTAARYDAPVSVTAQAGGTQPAPPAREVEQIRHRLNLT
jgi:hypothetical protein